MLGGAQLVQAFGADLIVHRCLNRGEFDTPMLESVSASLRDRTRDRMALLFLAPLRESTKSYSWKPAWKSARGLGTEQPDGRRW